MQSISGSTGSVTSACWRWEMIDVYKRQSFTRAFHDMEGMTPNQYRKLMTENRNRIDRKPLAREEVLCDFQNTRSWISTVVKELLSTITARRSKGTRKKRLPPLFMPQESVAWATAMSLVAPEDCSAQSATALPAL